MTSKANHLKRKVPIAGYAPVDFTIDLSGISFSSTSNPIAYFGGGTLDPVANCNLEYFFEGRWYPIDAEDFNSNQAWVEAKTLNPRLISDGTLIAGGEPSAVFRATAKDGYRADPVLVDYQFPTALGYEINAIQGAHCELGATGVSDVDVVISMVPRGRNVNFAAGFPVAAYAPQVYFDWWSSPPNWIDKTINGVIVKSPSQSPIGTTGAFTMSVSGAVGYTRTINIPTNVVGEYYVRPWFRFPLVGAGPNNSPWASKYTPWIIDSAGDQYTFVQHAQ